MNARDVAIEKIKLTAGFINIVAAGLVIGGFAYFVYQRGQFFVTMMVIALGFVIHYFARGALDQLMGHTSHD